MPVNKVYSPVPEKVISSYNYIDIAEGTGITRLYAFINAVSGANLGYNDLISGALTTSTSDKSQIIDLGYSSGGGGWTHFAPNITFSLSPFNLPKVIKGTAQVEIPTYMTPNLSNQQGRWLFTQVGIKKNNSMIASAASYVFTGIVGNSHNYTFKIPIDVPLTQFKKGDTLSLYLSGAFSQLAGSDHMGAAIGMDPASRNGTWINTTAGGTGTQLVLNVPFRLDL